MTAKAQNLLLTKSQAACLIALRRRKDSQPKIAIEAKLDLKKTSTALQALTCLGLAKQAQTKKWHATARGKTARFKTVPDRARRNHGLPGPGGGRLLELLDRPMKGSEIVEKLGVTHQRSPPAFDQAARTGTRGLRRSREPFLDSDARK